MPSQARAQGIAPLLTVEEVAEILRASRAWVYEHSGELGATRIAGLKFESEAIAAYI